MLSSARPGGARHPRWGSGRAGFPPSIQDAKSLKLAAMEDPIQHDASRFLASQLPTTLRQLEPPAMLAETQKGGNVSENSTSIQRAMVATAGVAKPFPAKSDN